MAEDRFSKEAYQLANVATKFLNPQVVFSSLGEAVDEAISLLMKAEKALAEGEFDAHS